MVNQLRKFSPIIAQISRHMCELLSIKSSWVRGLTQRRPLCGSKQSFRIQLLFHFYNPNAETCVCTCIIKWIMFSSAPRVRYCVETDWLCYIHVARNRSSLCTNRKRRLLQSCGYVKSSLDSCWKNSFQFRRTTALCVRSGSLLACLLVQNG